MPMFALLKRPKYDASPAFEAALAASRNPKLYGEWGVPDTLDGRFDTLLLHLWPQFKVLERENKFSQALYDFTFKRMELALRETGTGDTSVGKHMRAMMKAFYGRLVTYNNCQSDDQWREALRRNLYGTVENQNVPDQMIAYVKALRDMRLSLEDLIAGKITYPA